jgi:hypothetical protein
MKIRDITITLSTDGLVCEHENGARHTISLDTLYNWVKRQLRASL